MRSRRCRRPMERMAVLLMVAAALLWADAGRAGEPKRGNPSPRAVTPLPAVPISLAVATENGAAVVSDRWLAEQLSEAARLLAPQGVRIRKVRQRLLPDRFVALETPEDRDGMAAQIQPQVINVFVVRRLKDIDRPNRWIMGVRWRLRANLAKDYVILSAKALPTTLAHELGHYFGNPHTYVDNNIMSYRRSDPSAVRFDRHQGARMRKTVRRHLRTGRLRTAEAILEADKRAAASPKPGAPSAPSVAKPPKKP